jgi:hypothetical protein
VGLEPALGRFIQYDLQQHKTTTGSIMINPRCSEIFCREKHKHG